jgi:hypothetical protein
MCTVADVSALAWNVALYEKAQGGWLLAGGTSVSAPLIAGVYALAGNAATIPPGYAYAIAQRCSTSPRATTTGSTAPAAQPAVTATCAPPERATTPLPAWAPPTASAPSDPRGEELTSQGARVIPTARMRNGFTIAAVAAADRKGETFAEIAAGFGVGTTTAWRYAGETVSLLAAPGRRSSAKPSGTRRRPGMPTSSWTGRSSPSTGATREARTRKSRTGGRKSPNPRR